MIFQDPISSLNPRRTVRDSVLEPLDIWKRGTKAERGALVDEILESVGIDPRTRRREPAPPVLGWSVPAHLGRPRPRPRPDVDHLRRAGVGTRRERAGAGAQPARGPQDQVRVDVDVHRPRPGRREERQRSGRGDVPRQALRGGRERRPVRPAGASLHERPAAVDPRARSRSPITRSPISSASCRRRSIRRRDVASTPAAPTPTGCAGTDEPELRSMGDGHFVACHHPVETAVTISSFPASADSTA